MYRNNIVRSEGRFIPDSGEYLLGGKYLAFVLYQKKEHGIFRRGKTYWVSVYGYFFCLIVYAKTADGIALCSLFFGKASEGGITAQGGFYPGNQF